MVINYAVYRCNPDLKSYAKNRFSLKIRVLIYICSQYEPNPLIAILLLQLLTASSSKKKAILYTKHIISST